MRCGAVRCGAMWCGEVRCGVFVVKGLLGRGLAGLRNRSSRLYPRAHQRHRERYLGTQPLFAAGVFPRLPFVCQRGRGMCCLPCLPVHLRLCGAAVVVVCGGGEGCRASWFVGSSFFFKTAPVFDKPERMAEKPAGSVSPKM